MGGLVIGDGLQVRRTVRVGLSGDTPELQDSLFRGGRGLGDSGQAEDHAEHQCQGNKLFHVILPP